MTTLRSDLQRLAIKCAEDTPWAELLGKNETLEALHQIETALSEDSASVQARLWWVRCQLETGSIPLTALVSPLDEIGEQLRSHTDFHAAGIAVYGLVGAALLEKKQPRLASRMFEHASVLANMDKSSLSFPLLQAQQLSLQNELERAQSKREAKHYISSLEDRIAVLTKTVSSQQKASKKLGKEPAPEVLVSTPKEEVSTEEVSTDDAPLNALLTPPFPSRRKRFSLIAGGVAILILAALQIYFSKEHEQLVEQLAMEVQAPMVFAMQLPEVKALSDKDIEFQFALNNGLGEVNKRIQNISQHQGGEENQPSTETSSSSSPAPDDQHSSSAAAEKNDSPLRETTEPPSHTNEQTAIKDDDKYYDPKSIHSSAPVPQLPGLPPNGASIDAKRLASLTMESVGLLPEHDAVTTEENGKGVYEAPRRDSIPFPATRALDGSELRPYEVEQFSPPLRYRLLVNTEVLDAPSLLSHPIEQISREQIVKVVSRMGRWLEIRTKDEQRGYIFSQNAEPVDR